MKRPKVITAYVLGRQAELQAQGESVDSDIAHARRRLDEVEQDRVFFLKQAARHDITGAKFEELMKDTEESRKYWESELVRLRELRDNQEKVQVGIDYVNRLMANVETILPMADIPPDELTVGFHLVDLLQFFVSFG